MKTHVINFFAGPGTGKSTLAAAVFTNMKNKSVDVELVREYVKDWAWIERRPKANDQIYLLGKQAQAESRLYGKVKYIVTDSPILLAPIYEKHYFNRDITKEAAFKFMQYAQQDGVVYHNFFLRRYKAFQQAGRFETEEQARALDQAIMNFLEENQVPFTIVDLPFEDRVQFVHDRVHEVVDALEAQNV
jgi:nicotinamide riboside kinase